MSSLVLTGDTSGTVTVSAPAVAGTSTLTLQAGTATNSMNTLATAVASTSGTSIDFTALPSWIKRITVMFNGVSLSGTSNYLIQIGQSSGLLTTNYVSACNNNAGSTVATSVSGYLVTVGSSAVDLTYGHVVLCLMGSDDWTQQGILNNGSSNRFSAGWASLTTSLDRVRITTVNGTDTFDAGTINILYEG